MTNSTPPVDTGVSHTTTTIAMETPAQQSLDLKKTGFFDLPRELRNVIYEIVLVRQRKLQVIEMCMYTDTTIRLNNTRIYTSILRTCKAIKKEATPVLYRDNKFSFKSSPSAWRFLNMIGDSAAFVHRLENLDDKRGASLQDLMSVLALREHLIDTRCMCCVNHGFAVEIAHNLYDKRLEPQSWVALSASKVERHCRTLEGKEKVLELLHLGEEGQE